MQVGIIVLCVLPLLVNCTTALLQSKTRRSIGYVSDRNEQPIHHQIDDDYEFQSRDFRRFRLILPGTKWCGVGNVSEDNYRTGVFRETDKCCRLHDNCPYFIEPGKERHGLRNTYAFPKFHCDCENYFFSCLKNANTLLSRKTGRMYFNFFAKVCFKEEHPIISCRKYSYNILRRRCLTYKFDESKPKVYQWFDNPPWTKGLIF